MDKFESFNRDLKIGATKHITKPNYEGYILKFFKNEDEMMPLEEQRKILNEKRMYFGKYIPPTMLRDYFGGEYYIKQKYIKGKSLSEIDISSLSAETLYKILDLIKRYLKYCKEKGVDMDITGDQHYEGNVGKMGKRLRNFLKIYQNFLSSTNIIVSDEGEVFMVDVCESSNTRILGKIKNFCAKPFIKRTISQLEKLLQQKAKYEGKSEELFAVLDEK